jgi:hypothetical protein
MGGGRSLVNMTGLYVDTKSVLKLIYINEVKRSGHGPMAGFCNHAMKLRNS